MTASTFDIIDSNFDDFIVALPPKPKKGFDLSGYNELKRLCMNQFGFTYTQLFGLKNWELENLYFNDCPSVLYKITGKKRHWLRMQLDRVVEYLDLEKG